MKIEAKVKLTKEDAELIIQSLECLWDVEILEKEVDYEEDEFAQQISDLTDKFYKLKDVLE